ncbi:MAG: hypothetical protein AVDCRST_MAG36-591 [uncultured Nocardioidaceae bacterium]|uniref:Uncharacterized protein n=1 Tax=uncultured Nocardioidaceae bacterium TaxID=253824 RepID=A0A6J4L4S8_9ACTN|nr:MAG: hypothetical protein AVDCRST_MAG36-591 [uncultured Nocardioidaceae bacterium]
MVARGEEHPHRQDRGDEAVEREPDGQRLRRQRRPRPAGCPPRRRRRSRRASWRRRTSSRPVRRRRRSASGRPPASASRWGAGSEPGDSGPRAHLVPATGDRGSPLGRVRRALRCRGPRTAQPPGVRAAPGRRPGARPAVSLLLSGPRPVGAPP